MIRRDTLLDGTFFITNVCNSLLEMLCSNLCHRLRRIIVPQSANANRSKGDCIFDNGALQDLNAYFGGDAFNDASVSFLKPAFAGLDNILTAYKHAIEQRYRFYSYGDAMLIL